MKKIFIILGIIFLLLCSVTAVQWYKTSLLVPDSSGTATSSVTGSVLPLPTGTLSIPVQAGSVQIRDVRTIPEAQNMGEGMYHIEDTKQNGFAILYSELDKSFSISIEAEPIAKNRDAASAYFLTLLNINKTDACQLKVFVGVPYQVSETLAGQSLGLSYCPGSVQL